MSVVAAPCYTFCLSRTDMTASQFMDYRNPIQTADSMRELAASLHGGAAMLLRLIIQTPEIETKIAYAQCLFLMDQAASNALVRAGELRSGRCAVSASIGWTAVLPAAGSIEMIGAAVLPLTADLTARVQHLLDTTHPVWDEPSLRLLRGLKSDLLETESRLIELSTRLAREFGASPGTRLEPGAELYPARDSRFGDHREDLRVTRNEVAEYFYKTLILTEIPTIEHCCAILLEVPEIPPALRTDLMRQIWDEARHAQACCDHIAQAGGAIGGKYELDLWRLSRGRGLAFRLCAHQYFGEWKGIHAAFLWSNHYRHKDVLTADLLSFIGYDEFNHFELGLNWMKRLLPDELQHSALIEEVRLARLSLIGEREAHRFPTWEPVYQRLSRDQDPPNH